MRKQVPCPGPLDRRTFLRLGLGALGGLTLPELFRRRAAAAPAPRERTALIVIWLQGGASHLETYDPKPLAPSEYRGPYQPIATRVPGLQVCELLPRHALIARRCTILRSLVHSGFCHDNGPRQIFSGQPITAQTPRPENPDLFAIVDYLRPDPRRPLPNYVGVNPIPYIGAAYLGPAHEAFAVYDDPNSPQFVVPNIGLKEGEELRRLNHRMGLRERMDDLNRRVDAATARQGFDAFQTQAWNLLTGAAARRAFDINLEDPRVRDRYGRNRWGSSACWPAGWSKPASNWSPPRSMALSAAAPAAGTTTPSIITFSRP